MRNIDPNAGEWFTPSSQADKPEESRIRYKIRGLISTEAIAVTWTQDEEGHAHMTPKGANSALEYGLLGWENWKDDDGTPIEFDPKNRRLNILKLYPLDAIELPHEIWSRTFLSEEARKN